MKKGTECIVLAALCLLTIAACDPEQTDDPEVRIEYDLRDQKVTVNVPDEVDGFYVSCTDFIKFYEVDGETDEPIESALSYPLDAWTGYFLNGEFVPPVAGMGCDVLSCESLDGFERTYDFLRYEHVGERSFTDQEKQDFAAHYAKTPFGDNVPDSVAEYTSTPMYGKIKLEMTYWQIDTCTSLEAAETAKVYATELILE